MQWAARSWLLRLGLTAPFSRTHHLARIICRLRCNAGVVCQLSCSMSSQQQHPQQRDRGVHCGLISCEGRCKGTDSLGCR